MLTATLATTSGRCRGVHLGRVAGIGWEPAASSGGEFSASMRIRLVASFDVIVPGRQTSSRICDLLPGSGAQRNRDEGEEDST